jgi:hypothetical protein
MEAAADVDEPALGEVLSSDLSEAAQAMMLWNCSSSVPWLTIGKDATALPLRVYRSLGSAVRRPISATRLRDGPRRRGSGGVL